MRVRLVSVISLLLLMFPFYALAASKHSEQISLISPTQVANTQLKPGDYTAEWTGSGPQVQVKFIKNGKTVATVPATVQTGTEPYNAAALLTNLPNHTAVLKDIYSKNMILKFETPS